MTAPSDVCPFHGNCLNAECIFCKPIIRREPLRQLLREALPYLLGYARVVAALPDYAAPHLPDLINRAQAALDRTKP